MCTYPPIPLSSCVHAFIDPFMVQKSTPWLRDIGGSDSLMTWTLGLKNRWYLRWSRLRFIFQVYTIHITIYIYCNYYFNYQHLIYTYIYIYNIVITKYFKKKTVEELFSTCPLWWSRHRSTVMEVDLRTEAFRTVEKPPGNLEKQERKVEFIAF